MRTRTIAALLAATAVITGCSSGPTYDESVQQCISALKARPKGDTSKPKQCEPLKEDDYTLVVMHSAMGDLGWTDGNGRFDKDKMLNSTPAP